MSHQSLILYTVARLDTRWRDIEDGNGLPVTYWFSTDLHYLAPLLWLIKAASNSLYHDQSVIIKDDILNYLRSGSPLHCTLFAIVW